MSYRDDPAFLFELRVPLDGKVATVRDCDGCVEPIPSYYGSEDDPDERDASDWQSHAE